MLAGLRAPSVPGSPQPVPIPVEITYDFRETEPEGLDSDELLLARSYFDAQEYARAAHTIDATVTAAGVVHLEKLTPKTLALRCYALYMVWELVFVFAACAFKTFRIFSCASVAQSPGSSYLISPHPLLVVFQAGEKRKEEEIAEDEGVTMRLYPWALDLAFVWRCSTNSVSMLVL